MKDFCLLTKFRFYQWRNLFLSGRNESKLKIFVIVLVGLSFWGGLFYLFYEAFGYIRQLSLFAAPLLETLFSLFFFALWLMLTFSNGIILYSSLFGSSETDSLLVRPIAPEVVFLHCLGTGILFSSWAFLFLAAPLIAAFGATYQQGLSFYFFCALLFVVFLLIPATLGAILCLLVSRYLPKVRRQTLWLSALAVVAFGVYKYFQIRAVQTSLEKFSPEWVEALFQKFQFAQQLYLPSFWLSEGVLAASSGDFGRATFLLAYLLVSGLFFGALAFLVATHLYRSTYDLLQSFRGRAKLRERPVYRVVRKSLFWLRPELRTLILKDVKTFFRDPVQWSQLFLFLGLLILYILNLRSMEYHLASGTWKVIVTYLNFTAVSLTLATFTNRFVYPQVSLEGKRLWILMVCPLERREILLGKFVFSFGLVTLVGEGVVLLSSYMILAPWEMVGATAFLMVLLCAGLSGLSVGLGALYPQFHEDNPSKIVAGFGGTLTLVLSLAFVILLVVAQFLPFFLRAQGLVSETAFRWALGLSLGGSTGVSLLVAYVPFQLGKKAFERQEV